MAQQKLTQGETATYFDRRYFKPGEIEIVIETSVRLILSTVDQDNNAVGGHF